MSGLPRSFYARDVDAVARELLGCSLVHCPDGTRVGGRIVEVEAYGGPGDPGSHAHRAPSGRAGIMFGRPGVAYVYFTYGKHFCMNAVAHTDGSAGAVLLRAVEPVWGVEAMRSAGAPPALRDSKLASGPGRLCRAMGVGRAHNGTDLTRGPLRVEQGNRPLEVLQGTRVGLSADDGRPWRFWTPSGALSRSPAGGTRS